MQNLRRLVPAERYSEDEETLRAYSYDASPLEARPAAVVRPREDEEIRRIVVAANQNRVSLVVRGAGTGLRGGVVKEGAVIIDMRGFDAIGKLSRERATITVGAGVTVERLNRLLAPHGFHFPLIPEREGQTIGGLASVNYLSEESQLYAEFDERVASVTCFDGVGRYQTLRDHAVADVIGWEGTTCIITALELRLSPIHDLSLSVIPLEAFSKLAGARVLGIEFLDARCAKLLGLDAKPQLLVAHPNSNAPIRDERAREIWTRRKRLAQLLWNESFPFIEEASLPRDSTAKFIEHCFRERLPCYGHYGLGVLIAQTDTAARAAALRTAIVALGGTPGGKYGYGRTKAEFTPYDVKRRLVTLKERYDHGFVLNPGVIMGK